MTTADQLAAAAGAALGDAHLTLAVAESCTGGRLGDWISNVPGSSSYFLGGVIAYSYDAKEHLLGVQHNTLYEHGAVSRETALEMAHGARRAFRADLAASITGIAGPGGGMPGKPVGLVYIALVARDEERCEHYVWDGDRDANKQRSVEAALQMILDYLAGHGSNQE
jgi:PncC family amidohydrolase